MSGLNLKIWLNLSNFKNKGISISLINEETSISIEIDVSSFIKVFNYAKLFFIFISTIIELHFCLLLG